VGAAVSRLIGSGKRHEARRVASGSLLVVTVITAIVGVTTAIFLGPILHAAGAVGMTRHYALRFLLISSPSLPLIANGMCCSSLLRSVGDARRSMNVTLFAAVVTAIIDPILIFGLHLGYVGAAISMVISRTFLLVYAARAVMGHHLLGPVRLDKLREDTLMVSKVAGPAILTNLATPVGAAFLTHAVAHFGPSAVAGQAVADRIAPVAFGVIYALSGAVGPILAQNLGAGSHDRVRETLRNSLVFVLVTASAAWLVLYLSQDLIVRAFSATGLAADLVRLFCTWTAGSFVFLGALFVANAAFNNLGFPLLSTVFNWGRATLGTIPLVYIGAKYGAGGAMIGQALGAVVFGSAAAWAAWVVVGRMEKEGLARAGVVPVGAE